MNKDEFKGQWHQIKGKIKEKWGKLTDDEVTQIDGKYEQLVGTLQKRYGYAKDRAEEEIKSWNSSMTQTVSHGSPRDSSRDTSRGSNGTSRDSNGSHGSHKNR